MKNCRTANLLFAASSLAASFLILGPVHAASALTPPQHLVYQPGSLVWDSVPGADYYLVGEADSQLGPYHALSMKHLSTNAALPNLALNVHHYFVVYAAGKEGISQTSNPVDVLIKPYKQTKLRPSQVFPATYLRAHERRHCKEH